MVSTRIEVGHHFEGPEGDTLVPAPLHGSTAPSP